MASFLALNFPETRWLPESMAQRLAGELATVEVSGGATYDALVAATAVAHDLPLLTRDRGALETYRVLRAQVMLIA